VILEAIVTLLLGVITAVFSALPVVDADPFSSATGWFAAAGALDASLPVTETLAGVGLLIGIAASVFAVRLALTLWGAVPGKAS